MTVAIIAGVAFLACVVVGYVMPCALDRFDEDMARIVNMIALGGSILSTAVLAGNMAYTNSGAYKVGLIQALINKGMGSFFIPMAFTLLACGAVLIALAGIISMSSLGRNTRGGEAIAGQLGPTLWTGIIMLAFFALALVMGSAHFNWIDQLGT